MSFIWPRIVIHQIEISVKCTPEKASIGLQNRIPIPHKSFSPSFKDMEGCAVMQHDTSQSIKPLLP